MSGFSRGCNEPFTNAGDDLLVTFGRKNWDGRVDDAEQPHEKLLIGGRRDRDRQAAVGRRLGVAR
jgi:hypothetical protein